MIEKEKTGIKYIIIILATVAAQILISVVCWGGEEERYVGWNQHEGIIRFHVIANSNSKKDQELKLKVRDGVIKHIEAETKNNYSIDETRMYLTTHKEEITKVAEKIIKDDGFNYSVKTYLGVKWIKEKEYGGTTFPAGNYETFNIEIGEGQGENWWCVLFPPLCLVKKKKVKLRSIIMRKIRRRR